MQGLAYSSTLTRQLEMLEKRGLVPSVSLFASGGE